MKNEKQKTLINFKKAQSLMSKIIEMVETNEYCINIMQQNLAVIGLLKSAHQMLMENHLDTCFKKAMETGEIVLIKDDLRDVITAIDLSKYTFNKIKQNLFWAFFYNVVGIPIAAGILYPFTGWLLNPAIAAVAMAFSSVSVVGNALLMKRYQVKIDGH
jgi:DNA-binding FrmR family transcriptional regulator